MHSFNHVSLLKIIKIKKIKYDNPSQAKHNKTKWFKNILVLLFFYLVKIRFFWFLSVQVTNIGLSIHFIPMHFLDNKLKNFYQHFSMNENNE